MKQRSKPRVRARPALAVAVMVLVIALIFGGVVVNRLEPLSVVPTGASLPAAPTGLRWVTYRDAAVLVPSEWESMNGPGFLDCPGRWAGEVGLVITPRREPRSESACVVSIREPDVPSPYVRFSDQPEGPFTDEGHHATQQVGEAWVTVVWFRLSQRATVKEVFRSARTTELDAVGCPVRSIDVPASSNWDGSVETLTVCQFDPALSGSNLYSSFRLGGETADETWRALRHAPPIPSLNRADCPAGPPLPEAIPLRVGVRDRAGATHWVTVGLDDCGGVGVDLGDRLLGLSGPACEALMPVRPITPFPARRCGP